MPAEPPPPRLLSLAAVDSLKSILLKKAVWIYSRPPFSLPTINASRRKERGFVK
jgi:hypothetical protein